MTDKPYSPACARNRDPILAVLKPHFAACHQVLELGSGTGQHAVHFAAAMPWLVWQCSDRTDNLPGIRLWLEAAALPNTPAPLLLQAATRPRPGLVPSPSLPRSAGGVLGYDAVFSANTLHIMGWPEVEALFAGLTALLAPGATVVVYGPFNYAGSYTSDSNRAFDASLKVRDPCSGIRDFENVNALARGIGLHLVDDIAMPANNRCLVWRRNGGSVVVRG